MTKPEKNKRKITNKEKRNQKGVIVRFEILDDDDNIINVIAEQTFPDAVFKSWPEPYNPRFTKYGCFDKDVSEYVYKQHEINDLKFNYEDWENSPNVRQAFYNIDNDLMYTVDEVEYEMGL